MKTKKQVLTGMFILIYSLTLLFVLINSFTNRTEDHWRFFYNFTQQSNIMALAWFSLLGIHLITGNERLLFTRNRVLMVALAVYVSITYFIVALVLDPVYVGQFNPVKSGSELWLHHLTPFATWILLAIIPGVGSLTVKKSLLTLSYPLFYVILNLLVGSLVRFSDGNKAYAYGFINPDTYGGNYFVFALVILGLILVFGLFTVALTKVKTKIDQIEEPLL